MLLQIHQGLNPITDIPNVKKLNIYLPKATLNIFEDVIIEIIMEDKHSTLVGTLKVK